MAYTEYYSEICDILLFSHFTVKYVHFYGQFELWN